MQRWLLELASPPLSSSSRRPLQARQQPAKHPFGPRTGSAGPRGPATTCVGFGTERNADQGLQNNRNVTPILQALSRCLAIAFARILRNVLYNLDRVPIMEVRSVKPALGGVPNGCGALPCPTSGRGGRVPC